MHDSGSLISKNGYAVSFDTRKRAKHDSKHSDILLLKQDGVSIRKIANKLNIPFGSLHYILRQYGQVTLTTAKPSLSYLDRAECRIHYDMNNAQFDYATKRYEHLSKRINGKVYLHVDYLVDYFIQHKAHCDREERRRHATTMEN